jgi:hypothetical protein
MVSAESDLRRQCYNGRNFAAHRVRFANLLALPANLVCYSGSRRLCLLSRNRFHLHRQLDERASGAGFWLLEIVLGQTLTTIGIYPSYV